MILGVQAGGGLDACPPPPKKNPPGLHLELLDEIMETTSLHFQPMESFLLLSQLLLLGSCLHLQLCCPCCVLLQCLLCQLQLRLGQGGKGGLAGETAPVVAWGKKLTPFGGGKVSLGCGRV